MKKYIVPAAIAVFLLGSSIGGYLIYYRTYGVPYPVHFELTEETCQLLRDAYKQEGKKDGPPCRMSAYLYFSNEGYVAEGTSQNVLGKCMVIPPSSVKPDSLVIETDGARQRTTKCASQFQRLNVRDHGFL